MFESAYVKRIVVAWTLSLGLLSLGMGGCRAERTAVSVPAENPEPTVAADEASLRGSQSQPEAPRAGPLAPELDGGQAWLNTSEPLRLAQLKGHVVLLDFWTYCCINCMHVLPDLRKLEERFAEQPFVVIGVHSAKFETEREARHIREAMERHDVRHPVVVDSDFAIWRRYDIQAWPSLVLIDATGRVRAKVAGEPDRELLGQAIEGLLSRAQQRGDLVASSERFRMETPVRSNRPLSFPGKVVVDPDGGLAVTDSAHHRVVIADADERLVAVAGSGVEGRVDGSFTESSFNRPQGLSWHEGDLFVADTDNHAIRRLDIEGRRVHTVAGTGQRGEGLLSVSAGWRSARTTPLRSPWDLLWAPSIRDEGGGFVVAMAGSHQLFVYQPRQERVRVLSGSGRERLTDGTAALAAFAQPSSLALTSDSAAVYVADSETSAIRVVSLADGAVRTLVGVGLFDFGDEDGVGEAVRLQHPLGVARVGEDILWIADTFNDRLKELVPSTRTVRRLPWSDDLGLREPGGITVSGNDLLIVDTNHHRILRVDRQSGTSKEVRWIGLEAPALEGGVLERPRPDEGRTLP